MKRMIKASADYKSVYDLSRDELIELKQNYITELNADRDISYEELANADELVSDDTIFEEYRGTNFVDDDFWCNQ